MSRLFEEFAKKQEEEYMQHVKPCVQELLKQDSIEWVQFHATAQRHGLNSYERELLYAKLDDAGFWYMMGQFLNSGQFDRKPAFSRPAATYNESLERDLVFRLLDRLGALLKEQGKL